MPDTWPIDCDVRSTPMLSGLAHGSAVWPERALTQPAEMRRTRVSARPRCPPGRARRRRTRSAPPRRCPCHPG
eukprot:13067283-Alexandrium_andersonii.AAC.1